MPIPGTNERRESVVVSMPAPIGRCLTFGTCVLFYTDDGLERMCPGPRGLNQDETVTCVCNRTPACRLFENREGDGCAKETGSTRRAESAAHSRSAALAHPR